MNLIFQKATKNNFEEIVSHSFWWPDSAPRKNIFLDLVDTNAYYIAYIDDMVVGSFSYVILWDDTIMVQFLRIKEVYRKRWIARKMVSYIQDIWKEKWCDGMFSTVLSNNPSSALFHEKIWFRKSGNIEFKNEEIVYLKDIV